MNVDACYAALIHFFGLVSDIAEQSRVVASAHVSRSLWKNLRVDNCTGNLAKPAMTVGLITLTYTECRFCAHTEQHIFSVGGAQRMFSLFFFTSYCSRFGKMS